MMKVKLTNCGNPDRMQFSPVAPQGGIIEVASFEEASAWCRFYIEAHELGGGNWSGGHIYENGKQIARVSYNGRVWKGTKWVMGGHNEEISIDFDRVKEIKSDLLAEVGIDT